MIVVRHKCRIQLNKAAEYIAVDAPKQADILLDRFEETLKMIQRAPKIGMSYKKGMRRTKLGKFRYYVYYKETKTAIEILGIWHTSKGNKF
jgi:plasmid stabilization system protein ParE